MKKLKKVLKWAAVIVGVLLVVYAVVYTILDVSLGAQLRKRIEALKAQGEPTTFAEIAPDPVPDADNAAIPYNQAFVLMTVGNGGQPYVPGAQSGKVSEAVSFVEDQTDPLQLTDDNSRHGRMWWNWDVSSWTDAEREKVRQALESEELRQVFRVLEQGSKRPKCNFNLNYQDGPAMLLTHLAMFRGATKLLCLKSVMDAAGGNIEAACDSLMTALRMANHLRTEPVMISQLVAIACTNMTVAGIQDVSDHFGLPEARSREFAGELATFGGDKVMTQALDMERIGMGGCVFGRIIDGTESKWSIQDWSGDQAHGPGFFVRCLTVLFGRPVFKKSYICYLDAVSEQEKAYPMPYGKSRAELARIAENVRRLPWYAWPMGSIFWDLAGLKESDAFCRAHVNICVTGLALKAHKVKCGTYPDALKELAAEGLDAEFMQDPYSEKVLLYRKANDGFVLYGVGEDMKDDGGKSCLRKYEKTAAQSPDACANGDIVWTSGK